MQFLQFKCDENRCVTNFHGALSYFSSLSVLQKFDSNVTKFYTFVMKINLYYCDEN